MALKDSIGLVFRWPVVKALLNGIRRYFPADSKQLKLRMPVLETERLVLRPLDQDDLSDIVAWEDVASAPNHEAAAQEFLDYCFREYRERGIGPWGIQLKETGAIVGNCGFPDIIFKKLCGEVNYYVATGHRGKGLALEALNALLRFGFRDIGLTRIQARCQPDNLSSERVMQRAGMRFEGWIESAPSAKDPSPKQKLYAIQEHDFNKGENGIGDRAMNETAPSHDRS
jgi:RimJ/RimL family protein N-acetyltransferase